MVKLLLWIGMSVSLALSAPAVLALEKIVPAELLKPSVCPDFYKFEKNACVAKPGDVAKPAADTCKAAGFGFQGDANAAKCVAPAPADTPSPQCKALPGYEARIAGSGDAASCAYEPQVVSSAAGDYIGDCFQIKTVPPGSGLKSPDKYFVTGQRQIDGDDRELILVPGEIRLLPSRRQWIPHWGCQAQEGQENLQTRIAASKLIEAGATRMGYAYGFLTMPYKYFPSEKSFDVNIPIGPYLGWRTGQAGSGITWAVAATLSSVKADTVDPKTLDAAGKPTVTGTTNVAALAGAVGVIFDVLKSPRGRPFKAGIFVGKDVVSSDPTISYRFNRKTWVALQIGYDFTDD